MKKTLFFLLLTASEISAQEPTQAKMSSTTQSSQTMEGTSKQLEPLQFPHGHTPQSMEAPPHISLPNIVPQQAEYLHPGILVSFNGKWEGSDHLYNLPNNIGVYVSIIKPEGEILEINENQLRKEVEEIFSLARIKPQTLAMEGKPPLPAFEIEVFVYPIDRGYAAYIEGRLFESATLERFKMDPNMTFQAITWEKQHLIVSPKNQLGEQVTKVVRTIATSFIERFQAYERLKK